MLYCHFNFCEQVLVEFAPNVLTIFSNTAIIFTKSLLQMFEVNPALPAAPQDDSSKNKGKAGRQSRFSTAGDLVNSQEFAAASAHLAAFGETRGTLQEAAWKVNFNPDMNQKVSWKTMRDRYRPIQD